MQEEDFQEKMSPIRTIPATAGEGYFESGVQLMTLYMEHSYIFENEESAAKNAVALEWKSKSIYNEE